MILVLIRPISPRPRGILIITHFDILYTAETVAENMFRNATNLSRAQMAARQKIKRFCASGQSDAVHFVAPNDKAHLL
jgi:hypothetical protein